MGKFLLFPSLFPSSSSISTHPRHHLLCLRPCICSHVFLWRGPSQLLSGVTSRTSNCPSWSSTYSPLQKRTSTSTLPPELISFHNVHMRVVALRTATLRGGESCCVCPPLTWIWFLRYAATTAAHLSVSVYFLSTKTLKFSKLLQLQPKAFLGLSNRFVLFLSNAPKSAGQRWGLRRPIQHFCCSRVFLSPIVPRVRRATGAAILTQNTENC